MKTTRTDSAAFSAALKTAQAKLAEAKAALDPFLIALADEERREIPRTRSGFPAAARTMARASEEHPELAAAAGFDRAAVLEDLDNVEALAPVAEALSELERRVADTHLAWSGEAYVQTLPFYGIARVKGKQDGRLSAVTDPLAAVFSTRRAKPDAG